jgi:hypothetical protein
MFHPMSDWTCSTSHITNKLADCNEDIIRIYVTDSLEFASARGMNIDIYV